MKRGAIFVLLILVVAAVAVVVLGAAPDHGGGLLGSHAAEATAAVSPLPPTQLAKLPSRTLANGTEPLTVMLSAPVSPPRRRQR